MNELFGGVVYAGIDTDKHRYPIGKISVIVHFTQYLSSHWRRAYSWFWMSAQPTFNAWFSRAVSNCVPLDGVFVVIFFKIIIYNIKTVIRFGLCDI